MSGDESGGSVDLVWVSEAPPAVVAPSIEALLSTAPIATTTRAADVLNTAIEMFAAAVRLHVRDRDAGADLARKVENETRRTARKDDVLRAAIAVLELDILRPIRNALDANAGETTEAAALRVVSALRLERAAVKASDAIQRATPRTAAVRYYASQQDGELAGEVGHRIWYLSDCALVKTPEGDIIATSGDWIIRDARGDLYVLPHQDVGARRAATVGRPRTALEQFGDAVYNLGQPAGGWSALADKLEAEAAAVNTGDPIADLAKRSTLRDRAAVCRDWGARVYQVMGQRRAVDVGPTRRILVEGIPVEVSDIEASVTAGMPLEQARAMLGQAREAAEWREDERQPDVGGVEGEDAGGDPGVG